MPQMERIRRIFTAFIRDIRPFVKFALKIFDFKITVFDDYPQSGVSFESGWSQDIFCRLYLFKEILYLQEALISKHPIPQNVFDDFTKNLSLQGEFP